LNLPQTKQITDFNKIKHIFELKVLELKNVPILAKILKDVERVEKDQFNHKLSSKYIQNIYVKYIFPLDDEPLQSDYLTYPNNDEDKFTYGVQMQSSHSYLLSKEDQISTLLKRGGEFFNIQLSCLKESLEINLANA